MLHKNIIMWTNEYIYTWVWVMYMKGLWHDIFVPPDQIHLRWNKVFFIRKVTMEIITNITLKVTLSPLLMYNSGMRRPFRYKAMPHDCWPETLNIEQYKTTDHGGHLRGYKPNDGYYNPGKNIWKLPFVTSLDETKFSNNISTWFWKLRVHIISL